MEMNDDTSNVMTPFDCYTATSTLQLLKILIPFLPPSNQRMMAVYVRFSELQHIFSSFRNMKQCHPTPENIFDGMKPYLSGPDLETFDQMSNMMNMMSMMQEMQSMVGEDFDPMSMMAGMFAQEENTKYEKEGENP
jgi:hypothetical protein